MIPGGESFDIPVTDAGSLTAEWITRIPPGTNVLLAMSDGGARCVSKLTFEDPYRT
jgi:hypothetical protein